MAPLLLPPLLAPPTLMRSLEEKSTPYVAGLYSSSLIWPPSRYVL